MRQSKIPLRWRKIVKAEIIRYAITNEDLRMLPTGQRSPIFIRGNDLCKAGLHLFQRAISAEEEEQLIFEFETNWGAREKRCTTHIAHWMRILQKGGMTYNRGRYHSAIVRILIEIGRRMAKCRELRKWGFRAMRDEIKSLGDHPIRYAVQQMLIHGIFHMNHNIHETLAELESILSKEGDHETYVFFLTSSLVNNLCSTASALRNFNYCVDPKLMVKFVLRDDHATICILQFMMKWPAECTILVLEAFVSAYVTKMQAESILYCARGMLGSCLRNKNGSAHVSRVSHCVVLMQNMYPTLCCQSNQLVL